MARHSDRRVMDLAARQHGLVTRRQLLDSGLGPGAIKHRLRSGRLLRVHQGVYGVAPLLSSRAPEMAAVLACGPGAVLSHWSAGRLWELLPSVGDGEPVDVTVRGGRGRHRPGVRAHRTAPIEGDDVTLREGVPITSPARTLLDLSGVCGPRELERVMARAERSRLIAQPSLPSLLGRCAGRRGCRPLRVLLERGGPALTRSEAEGRFLSLIRKAQLPAPEANASLEGFEVDFLWRVEKVVVEVDGFTFHSSRSTFEADRLRDQRLSAAGFRVMRVTWSQIVRQPEAVLVRLALVLDKGRRRRR